MLTLPKKPQSETNNRAIVLIIDDSFENRLLLSSQLKAEGYEVLQADGGAEGIELALAHNPDLVLLDVMMPGMNGFEVCSHFKENESTKLTPIIMITALREVQYRIEGIEAGADEFLSRPHVREELLVRVRTLIQLKRARVNLEEERNRLQLLYDIGQSTNTQLDLETMMADIIAHTQAAIGATKGNIMLLDERGETSHKFLIRAGAQVEVSDSVSRAVMTEGLGGWVIKHKRGDIIEDISQDERWIMLPNDQEETGSAVGLPLTGAHRVVGVLILNHPQPGYFQQEHLSLLTTIGASVGAAIENADLFTKVSEERRKLEAILAQSTDAIITTDEEWHISLFNQSAEKLFNVTAAKVTNKSIRDVPQLDMLIPMFENASVHLAPQEINVNDYKTLYATISPIQGVGYAAVLQDITELKRMEELRLEQERREKEMVKETFSRYMGPRLVEHVLSHEPGLMGRRERRHAVVMFADLRNWTEGMISRVEPDEAIIQLNEFFTYMMEIALDNDGTVFELTADEILVGFNAPFDQDNAAYLALKTAVSMQHKFNTLRQGWYKRAGAKLGLGIGIDQGNVLMGNVGAESRLSFRMVGEAMNNAHRLVDLAQDGQIVVSKSVRQALVKTVPKLIEQIKFDEVGPIKVKGIAPQIVYATQIKRPPLPSRRP